jgi:hypothetical protein
MANPGDAVSIGIRERLLDVKRRLRAAVDAGAPGQLVSLAQDCLVDIDCALADPQLDRGRPLCAQAEALIATLATCTRPTRAIG